MAQRGSVTYLGALYDPAFGIDAEGVLFCTQQDAIAALHAWHRNTDPWKAFPVRRPDGQQEFVQWPILTDEARILLWQLNEIDRTYEPLVAKIAEEHPINAKGYMALPARHAVWVGARQAIRHGSIDQFYEQYLARTRVEVREAGSVVVTDV